MIWWSYILWSDCGKCSREHLGRFAWAQAGHIIFFSDTILVKKRATYIDIRHKNIRNASLQFRIRKFLYVVQWFVSSGCIEVLHPFKYSVTERMASSPWVTLSLGGLETQEASSLTVSSSEKRPLADWLTTLCRVVDCRVVTCCSGCSTLHKVHQIRNWLLAVRPSDFRIKNWFL